MLNNQTAACSFKSLILVFALLLTIPYVLPAQGLEGYISSSSTERADGYDMGLGFYSAIWTLTPNPIQGFQIGLPGTWIIPDNNDNSSTPLCPIGTVARDNWPERGPTYRDVFQTMEGGIGYWAGNRFHYGPPKYSMNSTPNCYSNEIASPGWGFFRSGEALPDNFLGIAQISNRMLIPPDGLTFDGTPHGAFLGYGYIALPLTEERNDPQPTGNNNWTLFLNAGNFKGPLAYFLPETWSRISKDYPFDHGRGLDSRPTIAGAGGTMEINTVPLHKSMDNQGVTYTKIPQIQFPVDEEGKTILTRELAYYSKEALYNDVLAWKSGGTIPSGFFKPTGVSYPKVVTYPVNYRQEGVPIQGINELARPQVFADNAFGLQWNEVPDDSFGRFPEYYKEENNTRIGLNEADLPGSLDLKTKSFPAPNAAPAAYSVNLSGAWANPGPSAGPFQVELKDGSIVTYYWYRFIDQPVFQQYNWTTAEKEALQALIETMHEEWTIDKNYMHPLAKGELVSFDQNLLVTPPAGLEKGFVPIVTRQSTLSDIDCQNVKPIINSQRQLDPTGENANRVNLEIAGVPDEQFLVKWSNGAFGKFTDLEPDQTYSAVLTYRNSCSFYHYSPPVALNASGNNGNSFFANWEKVPSAPSYLIDVASDSLFTSFIEGWENRAIGNSSKIEIPLVDANIPLYYRLQAKGFNGEKSAYSKVIVVNSNANDCQLDVEVQRSNLSSASQMDGRIALAIRGARGNLSYNWSNGSQQATLNNLARGTYAYTVTDQAGCTQSSEVKVGLPVGKNSIGNRVWMDLNRNGFDDFDEPGIADVGLVLWVDRDGDQNPESFVGITKTDQNGYYQFTDLVPGVYQVFVWEIDNWAAGGPLEGLVNTIGVADPNNDVDGDDNGQDAGDLHNLSNLNKITKPIVITADGEPLLDGDPIDPNFDYDPSGNRTIDFGFYDPATNCPPLNFTINGSASTCAENPQGQLSVALASGIAPFQYTWDNGARTAQVEGLSPGTYHVSVTDKSGCRGTGIFVIAALSETACDNVTSIKASTWLGAQISVFPNPGQDQLVIRNQSKELLNIQIISEQGRLEMQQKLGLGQQALDTEGLAKGLYILQFTDQNQTKTVFKKWIKI
jgi:hypothetical protein